MHNALATCLLRRKGPFVVGDGTGEREQRETPIKWSWSSLD